MPQEIKTFAFEGHALTFRQDNGEWWATAEEAAPLLGYARSQSVVNIFNRHKSEFRPGESGQLDLSYPDGGTQRTRVFSPRGLARLCLLGRTEVSRRLHDWVIYDVMEALRTGARVVTEEQMREAIRVAVDAVVQQYAGQIGHLSSSLSAVARVAEVQASNAGRLLSLMSRDPEVVRGGHDAASSVRVSDPGPGSTGPSGNGIFVWPLRRQWYRAKREREEGLIFGEEMDVETPETPETLPPPNRIAPDDPPDEPEAVG